MLLALDISTSTIGLAIFSEDHKLHELSHIKFKQGKNLFVKLEEFIKFFEKYEKLPINEVIIEEPLRAFKGKFSSAQTISILNFFNGMISSYLFNIFNTEPIYYNVQHARKLAFPNLLIPKSHPNKKALIMESIINIFPTLNFEYSKRTFKLKEESFDMADAIVVGLAHIVSKIRTKEALATEDIKISEKK